ncbi:hypothetical protein RUM44_005302 [Polyplax serrata]|uniref:Transient receptor ion channel domain-containing protein n=1 Tax=Polyplax serrata TaxID=468196 RepID=A0ABR1AD65_POLSC
MQNLMKRIMELEDQTTCVEIDEPGEKLKRLENRNRKIVERRDYEDNYEIIKILLDRGATLPDPHHVRCGCKECVTSRQEDSLRHSRSRINAYRALASPSLIALSSKDPILTAFELSWELRRLSFLEHEFKIQYQELRKQCQDFATALLDHTRSSYELEVLLNHDPTGPAFEHGERMHLNRLKLAIKLRQKKFVAHPNVQQLLASIWYEGLPGFRRKNMFLQALEIVRIGTLFPFFSLMYIIAPHSKIGQTMRKPFIKFICNSASYLTFLFLLILASQRIETVVGDLFGFTSNDTKALDVSTKRGALPSIIEWLILFWVSGLIWSEVKQLWDVGIEEYVHDMWNVIDFVTMSLYVATVALRIVAYYRVQMEMSESTGLNKYHTNLQREEWDTWDPMLIAEGLFSAANIFSSLKLVYIFSVNPYLGPLQVSLSRMVLDIMKFFFLYVLVLFAFSCGLNQLLWYYADMEKKKCVLDFDLSRNATKNLPSSDRTACLVWRRFSNLFETSQTLFWAVFGLIDLDSFELEGIKTFTRFWGMLMFGTYSVINIVVLLNLLIAMMNHSYQLISVGVKWLNTKSMEILLKNLYHTVEYKFDERLPHGLSDFRMRRDYVHQREEREESSYSNDFQCLEKLMFFLRKPGRPSYQMDARSGGKKNRQKERRLMKGFNIAPTPGSGVPLAPVAEFIANLQVEPEIPHHQDHRNELVTVIHHGYE